MSTANDEFSNLLDFGINLPDLDGHGPAPTGPREAVLDRDSSMNQHDYTTQPPQLDNVMADSLPMEMQHHHNPPQGFPVAQQQQPQQQQHHHHHHHHQQKQPPNGQNFSHHKNMIPPTPNSVELHAGVQYPPRLDTNHDVYGTMNEDQVRQSLVACKLLKLTIQLPQSAFYTPLISPAMTPLETQFRIPEYTIPGEYFTPLTSPALEAQNAGSNTFSFQTTQPPSSSMSVEQHSMVVSAPSSPAVLRKARRRPSTAMRTGGRAGKAASPSIQPKNRLKQAMSAQLLAEDQVAQRSSDAARPATSIGGNTSSLRYESNDSSQDSVSPEPLSEPLMPPPALPHTRKSPAMGPQRSEPQSGQVATPATLMNIQTRQHIQESSGHFSGYATVVSEPQDEPMEDISLPEAATATTTSMYNQPQAAHADVATDPAASAKNTPFIEPQSANTQSTNPQPTSKPPSGSVTPTVMPSPSGPVPKKDKERKQSVSRGKRPSIASSHVSPALRPRISPNIQPLVRGEGEPSLSPTTSRHSNASLVGLSSDISALYLASKSNYQHIIDGTVLPGVTYPEHLAENLSSKRTNHKLAEQGRRNRINTALKEIESLLPPGFAQERLAKEGKEPSSAKGDKDKPAHHPISKASTVELAIDYIKSLQRELAETKEQLRQAESKLNGQEGSNSTAENASNGTDAKSEQPANPSSPPPPPPSSSSAPAASSSPLGVSTDAPIETNPSEQQKATTNQITTDESTTAGEVSSAE